MIKKRLVSTIITFILLLGSNLLNVQCASRLSKEKGLDDYIGLDINVIKIEKNLERRILNMVCNQKKFVEYLKGMEKRRTQTKQTLPSPREMEDFAIITRHLKWCKGNDTIIERRFKYFFNAFFKNMKIKEIIEKRDGKSPNPPARIKRELLTFLRNLVLELFDERLPSSIISDILSEERGFGFHIEESITFSKFVIKRLQTFNQTRLEEYLSMIKNQKWFESFEEEVCDSICYYNSSSRLGETIKKIAYSSSN